MALSSDLSLNVSAFADSAVSDSQRAFNDMLTQATKKGPQFWEIGAGGYRRMREEGKTAFPPRVVLDTGRNIEVPSRDSDRTIPCRVMMPQSGAKPLGVFMHIHGGGWTLQSHLDYDPFCTRLTTDTDLVVVSVGYRLAPEHPFPAGVHDCYDVADWLAGNAEKELGAKLQVIGGESAGGHLSMLSSLWLLQERSQPYEGVKALVLHYGGFDLSGLPSTAHFDLDLVLGRKAIHEFKKAFVGDKIDDDQWLRQPSVSPFYANLKTDKLKGKLPAALFTVGTLDALLDDTLFMSVRWLAAGAEAIVKIMPGQAHGYATFDPKMNPATDENFVNVSKFLKGRLG